MHSDFYELTKYLLYSLEKNSFNVVMKKYQIIDIERTQCSILVLNYKQYMRY